jgi:hypothetical protein
MWTAHGDSLLAAPAAPWIRVGTVPLAEYQRLWAGPDQDVARSVAFTALFALMDRTAPVLPDQQRNRLWRATHDMLDDLADGWERWPTTIWHIDGQPATGHVATWAGAWAGISFKVPGVALIVVAHASNPPPCGWLRWGRPCLPGRPPAAAELPRLPPNVGCGGARRRGRWWTAPLAAAPRPRAAAGRLSRPAGAWL